MQGPHPFELVSKWKDSSDDLNLAGILNVLDGVVDCPGRILIMTSNHPEKLDPALVRPGRINRRLFLDYMTPHDARRMVAHHFPDASPAELQAFEDSLTCTVDDHPSDDMSSSKCTRRMAPAQLESMCAEHDEISTLTASLQFSQLGKCGAAAAPARSLGLPQEEQLAVASVEGPLSPSSLTGDLERKKGESEMKSAADPSCDSCKDTGGAGAGVFGSLTVLGPEV